MDLGLFWQCPKSVGKKIKELNRAERLAVQGGNSSWIVQLKKDINIFMGKKKGCGGRGHALYILKRGTEILSFFTAEQPRENTGTANRVSATKQMKGALKKTRFFRVSWNFTSSYLHHQTQKFWRQN